MDSLHRISCSAGSVSHEHRLENQGAVLISKQSQTLRHTVALQGGIGKTIQAKESRRRGRASDQNRTTPRTVNILIARCAKLASKTMN